MFVNLSNWILSIVGLAFLNVLVDTVLPSSRMKEMVKLSFSIILIYEIINPILHFDFSLIVNEIKNF